MSRAKLGENAVKSSLGVHRLIEDLCLKLSILGKNSRNNITGRSPRWPVEDSANSHNPEISPILEEMVCISKLFKSSEILGQ